MRGFGSLSLSQQQRVVEGKPEAAARDGGHRTTLHCLSWIMAGERNPLSPNRHSLQIWLWGCCPYWATAPSTGAPPQGAPHTCVTGPAGISLTTPPSWIPVTVCLFSALCICTLLLMLITAHALLLSSSLLMHLPPLKHSLVSHAPALQVVRCCRTH
jgi:hypothetical protein